MPDWITLDGYGVYVWPCYAMSVAAVVGLAVWSIGRHRAVETALARATSLSRGGASIDAGTASQEPLPACCAGNVAAAAGPASGPSEAR